MSEIRIPVYAPDLSGNEKKFVTECIDTSWISARGRFVADFETGFAQYIGAENVTTVCNGTVALHLAMLALGIGPGDEVIVPTLTYVATANAVTYVGAKPVFVDSDPISWQISPACISKSITSKTKAIIPVHLYGDSCDMDSIMAIANEHNLFVIEDCAEAIGTTFKGRHVGTFGDVATFSFFGNKTITTGEGGMVAVKSKEVFDRARRIKGQGLAANREYWHDIVGHNFRMTNVAAAIGVAQLEKVDQFVNRKREIAQLYQNALQGRKLVFQPESPFSKNSRWMVSILTEKAQHREPLRNHLRSSGIETRPVFYPIHTMPIYASEKQIFPVAEDIASRGISLPSWPGLSDSQVSEITETIKSWLD
jgi:perosamine synthetase